MQTVRWVSNRHAQGKKEMYYLDSNADVLVDTCTLEHTPSVSYPRLGWTNVAKANELWVGGIEMPRVQPGFVLSAQTIPGGVPKDARSQSHLAYLPPSGAFTPNEVVIYPQSGSLGSLLACNAGNFAPLYIVRHMLVICYKLCVLHINLHTVHCVLKIKIYKKLGNNIQVLITYYIK